jgi:hypothetical protein
VTSAIGLGHCDGARAGRAPLIMVLSHGSNLNQGMQWSGDSARDSDRRSGSGGRRGNAAALACQGPGLPRLPGPANLKTVTAGTQLNIDSASSLDTRGPARLDSERNGRQMGLGWIIMP